MREAARLDFRRASLALPPFAVDPAFAESLAVVGVLTLGGVVLIPRAVICIGAGAALGMARSNHSATSAWSSMYQRGKKVGSASSG